jgi:signal transduction histidine kinase
VAAIQHNHVESVRILSEMRGAARDMRHGALLAYRAHADPTLGREEQLRVSEAAAARFASASVVYARFSMTPEEQALWAQLRSKDLPPFLSTLADLRAAAPPQGSAAMRALLERGVVVDADLERLVGLNADAAQAEARDLEGTLSGLSWGYAALAAVGTAGAVVLLLLSVGVVRRYEEATSQRMAELEAFAGQVSHDLRSPLQAVQLAVDGISRASTDAKVVRLAQRALAGAQRLDVMIRDLLQFARAGAPTGQGHADVCQVLASAEERLRPLAEGAAVELVVRTDAGAGAGLQAPPNGGAAEGAPLLVEIPPVALETVLANLLENAVKYRSQDRENRVEITARAVGDRVLLTVADTGIGIAPDLLPRVFQPFFRGNERPDSYGLGLSAVKRLVETHGGTVRAASEEGRGTTFTIDLPRARGAGARGGVVAVGH